MMGLLQFSYVPSLRHHQPKDIPIGQRSDTGSLLVYASFQYHGAILSLYTSVLDYCPRYVEINVPIHIKICLSMLPHRAICAWLDM